MFTVIKIVHLVIRLRYLMFYTRIYSYILQFYTHNGSNHKSRALYEIYITYNLVLYNRIVCTPSVNITFVVFASAGFCTDIADFRTSR